MRGWLNIRILSWMNWPSHRWSPRHDSCWILNWSNISWLRGWWLSLLRKLVHCLHTLCWWFNWNDWLRCCLNRSDWKSLSVNLRRLAELIALRCISLIRIKLSMMLRSWRLIDSCSWIKHVRRRNMSFSRRLSERWHFMLLSVVEYWRSITKDWILVVLISKVLHRFLRFLLRLIVILILRELLNWFLRLEILLSKSSCELILTSFWINLSLILSWRNNLFLYDKLLSHLEWLLGCWNLHFSWVSRLKDSIRNHSSFFIFISMHMDIFHHRSWSTFLSKEFSNFTHNDLTFNWLISHIASFLHKCNLLKEI